MNLIFNKSKKDNSLISKLNGKVVLLNNRITVNVIEGIEYECNLTEKDRFFIASPISIIKNEFIFIEDNKFVERIESGSVILETKEVLFSSITPSINIIDCWERKCFKTELSYKYKTKLYENIINITYPIYEIEQGKSFEQCIIDFPLYRDLFILHKEQIEEKINELKAISDNNKKYIESIKKNISLGEDIDFLKELWINDAVILDSDYVIHEDSRDTFNGIYDQFVRIGAGIFHIEFNEIDEDYFSVENVHSSFYIDKSDALQVLAYVGKKNFELIRYLYNPFYTEFDSIDLLHESICIGRNDSNGVNWSKNANELNDIKKNLYKKIGSVLNSYELPEILVFENEFVKETFSPELIFSLENTSLFDSDDNDEYSKFDWYWEEKYLTAKVELVWTKSTEIKINGKLAEKYLKE